MPQSAMSVSFVIPAFNEELFLPQVIDHIKKHMPAGMSYEVLVADNGSTDHTVELAEQRGAKVFIDTDASIGGLRNLAVSHSSGEVLVFLDADILLTDDWQQKFPAVFERLQQTPMIVTGSRYGIPSKPSWIERVWFKPLIQQPSKYINSGHLVTSRKLFNTIDGFDASLETGEDYAFGMASKNSGAEIINDPELYVVHKGYPKTLYQFMRREMWHGRSDCDSIGAVMSSKVAMSSMVFMVLHLALLAGVLSCQAVLSWLSLGAITAMCMLAAITKHDVRSPLQLPSVSFMYYLYFFSRFLSCISAFSVRSVKRKEVEG